MTVDLSVVPGLLFLLAELVALVGVGYVIVRVALRETDQRVALAQGLVVGPAIWGVVVNLVMYALPGMAGAAVGWIFVLALAAVLVWRSRRPVRPRLRTTTRFAAAALALFWIALASRQTLGIADAYIHLGLSASIRAGGFPPELPWKSGPRAPYHYGVDILNGLLTPPSGPDLAFTNELLGAFGAMSLIIVVVTALLRRTSIITAAITAPLLLTAGAWTLVHGDPESIVDVLAPAGIPAAGLRASLTDAYWPSARLPYSSEFDALANIWKPTFTLSYALALIVLARAAQAGRRSWPAVTTLAALVGFLGLTSTTLAPIVFVLWAGLETVQFIKSRRKDAALRSDAVPSICGLVLATMLLLSGGFSTFIPGSAVPSGTSVGLNEYFGGWRLLGTLERPPGGLGIPGPWPAGCCGRCHIADLAGPPRTDISDRNWLTAARLARAEL